MKKIKQLLCVFALAIPFVAGAQSMQIRIATTSGDEQSFRSAEELMKTNFTKLKEVRIYSNSNNEVQVSEALLRRLFSEAQQLEVLEIKEVGIASFPELSVENKTLKVLVLRLNNLSKLPENIGSLSALQTIDIYNPITEVPASLMNLKQLENLKFEGAEFTDFPEQVFALPKLKSLIISQFDTKNKIKVLPDNFDKLPLLEELSLRNAALSEVPASVGRLPKLENVYFNANNLTKLPQALAENPRLTYVNINDNPLDFKQFIKSIEKIQWKGVLYINNRNFTTQQYEEVEKRLPRISVFYTQREE
ncbi:leucine-rich repeat domain-containing protein [Capnocytophaga sp. oral taxon 324]|uniref:leucine-rich repeat domain-containing protein n=1 Tax=Capnocytophaga sp. oral taxon 324 TaxID=712211 RepID=UPI0002A1F497|nr:leucine Rich repeat-containing domain protein [Capnocytophaga sp. oral taxon 324]EKY17287.1 leucine Rich repeat-containing domain protein [Capnocytophaga sp. oral taxon 324 str. F0483]